MCPNKERGSPGPGASHLIFFVKTKSDTLKHKINTYKFSNFCVESGLFCMGVWPVLQRTVKQLIHFSMGKKVVFKIAHKSQNMQ